MKTLIWSSTFFLLLAGTVSAGDACPQPACCEPEQACCGKCGGASICKIVCEMKKVKKTVWTVECEEFCTMLPGCGPLGGLCCRDCGDQCGDAGIDVHHCAAGRRDRRRAIRLAISLAGTPASMVALCGRGCERYQKMAGLNIPFDDREVARDIMQSMPVRRRLSA